MRRREFLVQGSQLLGIALLPSASCVRRSPLGVPVADVERRIATWMQESRTPGLAIAIIQDGEVAWRRGFGVKDVASQEPVKDGTMFEAASMSKPAFAYVVLKLCETGVMDLDTPLTRYTTDRFLEADARLERITARHVLSHTSGFQNWRSEEKPLAIHHTPGEKYLYSGEGYNYLQTVVTRLLGEPFDTYMKARLLDPMGMASSGYVWRDPFSRLMARPHDVNGKPFDNKRSTAEGVARYGSAGALLTTATDYARFLISIIDPRPGDAYRLKPETIAEMLRPHVKLEGGRFPASWALGWQIFHNANRDFIYHGGDNEGFHCAAVASVEGKSGFVVMTNGENGTAVLRNLIIDEDMQRFLGA